MSQKLFITGGSGYIGSVVTSLAIAEGKTVHALSRSEASDEKLRNLGAVPIRGDLTSLDVLREQSAAADVVIHLATVYVLGQGTYDDAMPTDVAAMDAIADGMAGYNKPLVVTGGTLAATPDPSGGETTEDTPLNPHPLNTRSKAEAHALGYVDRGIRVMSVRLAPYVYGRGGSGVKLFMGMASQSGSMTCIDGGKNRTTSVHVDDTARLLLLASEKGKIGEIYNASSNTTVTARELFGAISAAVGVPLQDITSEEAFAQLGEVITFFLKIENRASGEKAARDLGWERSAVGILEDIENGSYQSVAAALKKS